MDTTPETATRPKRRTRMERPVEGRILGGVATAIANATGVAVGIVRTAFVVSVLFGGLGLVLYAVAWALIPSAGEEHPALERWLNSLTTPGRRLGAALISAALLIVLVPMNGHLVGVGLLLLAAGFVLRRPTHSTPNS